MFRLSMDLSERGYGWFQFAPTNLLLAAIRYRRQGLKWGIPAMILLGGGYIGAMIICTTILSHGGPGWLNILVLLFAWNAFKFIGNGPVCLIVLLRVRALERKAFRSADASEQAAEGVAEDSQSWSEVTSGK